MTDLTAERTRKLAAEAKLDELELGDWNTLLGKRSQLFQGGGKVTTLSRRLGII